MCRRISKQIAAFLLSLLIVISLPLVSTSVQAANSGDTNVFVTVPWDLINRCGHQAVSGPCQAYCWAYCRIILDNTAHTYRDYYVNGVGGAAPSTVGYNDGQGAASTSELLKIVYDNINIGRPVMLRVVGSKKADGTYNNHFVVAIGYKANSNPDNLKESDIFILDPANKAIKEDAGANETYTYLSSRTLSGNRYWTAKSGGTSVTSADKGSSPDKPTTYADCNVEIACINGQTVNLYNNPGDTTRVTYFSKGQTVRSAYCATLNDGSTWYRVNAYHNEANRIFWLKYESNKMTVTCSNHTYDAERCTICGAILNYDNDFDSSAAGTYKITENTAYVRTGPYQVKDLVKTMKSGETVQIVGSVINSYGNIWLKTSEGYYTHAEKLSKASVGNGNVWSSWSNWSATPVTSSSTREVETRQVLISEGNTEYRYGRYIDSTGTHDCWCSKYLEGLRGVTGSAILDYSDWSTTQYNPAKTYWTCGFCSGNHNNVDHYTEDGRPCWKQFILPSGSYYWEEVRTVDSVYETQYRYRDIIA